jgi:hypothetical protein
VFDILTFVYFIVFVHFKALVLPLQMNVVSDFIVFVQVAMHTCIAFFYGLLHLFYL